MNIVSLKKLINLTSNLSFKIVHYHQQNLSGTLRME